METFVTVVVIVVPIVLIALFVIIGCWCRFRRRLVGQLFDSSDNTLDVHYFFQFFQS